MAAQAAVFHLDVETDTPQATPPQDAGPRRLRMTWFVQGMGLAALMLIGVAAIGGFPHPSHTDGGIISQAYMPAPTMPWLSATRAGPAKVTVLDPQMQFFGGSSKAAPKKVVKKIVKKVVKRPTPSATKASSGGLFGFFGKSEPKPQSALGKAAPKRVVAAPKRVVKKVVKKIVRAPVKRVVDVVPVTGNNFFGNSRASPTKPVVANKPKPLSPGSNYPSTKNIQTQSSGFGTWLQPFQTTNGKSKYGMPIYDKNGNVNPAYLKAERAAMLSKKRTNIVQAETKRKGLISSKQFELADYVRKKIGNVGSGQEYYQSGK